MNNEELLQENALLKEEIERLKKKAFGYFRKEGFVCYYWFIGWWHWSLGINIYPKAPNFEIHLPFGFIRIGIQDRWMIIEKKKI